MTLPTHELVESLQEAALKAALPDHRYLMQQAAAALVSATGAISPDDVAKLVAAVRYVDCFFPKSNDTLLWEKENAEAVAIARRSATDRP